MNDGLRGGSDANGYNGIGWIASLQALVENTDIVLGMAYISDTCTVPEKVGNTSYFPVYRKTRSSFQKLKEYYGGYKHWDREEYVPQIQSVIAQFNPDVIHLFGIENDLATILGRTDVPVIVHLQGLLGPYANAFFPPAMNGISFLNPPTLREWGLRNGSIYAFNKMGVRVKREAELFKFAKFFMGRTKWDYEVSRLMSPDSQYFPVNEVLRPEFYDNAGTWKYPEGKIKIVSTISETVYKGLDVILKTAAFLKDRLDSDICWKVIGVNPDSLLVRQFEHICKIRGNTKGVIYAGVKEASELAEELKQCNIYVHPSYIDNSPNSVCEAQIIGVPVIAANVGGVSSLIKDGDNGILVPANGVYELAYAIKCLHYDRILSVKIGAAGHTTAEKRHNRTDVVKSLLRSYQIVIDNSKNNK